jgi:acetate kinase
MTASTRSGSSWDPAGEKPVLVVNAGSHSLKLAVLDADLALLGEADIDAAPDSSDATDGLIDFLDRVPELGAVGHRIVHGGPHLSEHSLIGDRVRSALEDAASLAPQHVPPALAALDTCRRRLPDIPQVACLDTVFHASLPEAAYTYPVPAPWRRRYGLRRYGFHGLSYAWTLARTANLLGRDPAELQVVLTHLGGGSSVCAVLDGISVWTSMGFTPLEGLPMSRRSGSVDPGMLLWLQTEHGLSTAEVSDGLEHRSGLFGLSDELSGDTRELVDAAEAGSRTAKLALDVFTLRVRQEIAAAAASLERVDAVVFSGEIGADQPEIREAVTAGLAVLGLQGCLDPNKDDDAVISHSGVPVLLVKPDEQRQIAIEVSRVLKSPHG